MSSIAGIDFSSCAIDVVLLDEDTDHARTLRWNLDTGPKSSPFDRAKRVRDLLPVRQAWADSGVTAIVLERPMGAQIAGIAPLMRVQGAILSCLPRNGVEVVELSPSEWRSAIGMPGNCAKERCNTWARSVWADCPRNVTRDQLDAYAIAYAYRNLDRLRHAA